MVMLQWEAMKKRRSARRRPRSQPVRWLPIDSRLVPDIFSFTYVRGYAAFFLKLEMILALLVVAGTLVLVVMSALG